MHTRAAPKRDHLLEVATVLFHRYGYHAVSVDQLLEQAEVSRPTFFKHFPSKDDLIVAALKRRDTAARERFFGALNQVQGDVKDKLLSMFDMLDAWVRSAGFTGCLFINATAEFADHKDPIHQAAKAHKDAYREILTAVAREGDIADPEALAEQLMILADGVIVTCHVAGAQLFPQRAKVVAAMLIDQARA